MLRTRSHLAAAALFATSALCAQGALAETLKVGMDATYPPFESYDENDKIVGVDVEIISEIASRMGREAELIDTKFANLITGLSAGHFDVVISGMYVTEERQKQALAIAYGSVGASVLAQADSELVVKSEEDLCGKTLGLLNGSAWVAMIQDLSTTTCEPAGKGAITVNEYPSAPEVTQALLSRNIEAQVEMGPAANEILTATGDRLKVVSEVQIYPLTLGLYLPKDATEMAEAVTKAFAEMKADGSYAGLMAKYNLVPVAD